MRNNLRQLRKRTSVDKEGLARYGKNGTDPTVNTLHPTTYTGRDSRAI